MLSWRPFPGRKRRMNSKTEQSRSFSRYATIPRKSNPRQFFDVAADDHRADTDDDRMMPSDVRLEHFVAGERLERQCSQKEHVHRAERFRSDYTRARLRGHECETSVTRACNECCRLHTMQRWRRLVIGFC